MKKSDILQNTSLIVLVLVIITGCTLLATRPVKTNPTPIVKNTSSRTPTPKAGQSQFVPLINSGDQTVATQPDPALQATTDPLALATPQPTVDLSTPANTSTPTKKPVPTLFWPTPANMNFSTPYVRQSGEHGETLPPEQWQKWPVLPVVSDHALDIYRKGISEGHDAAHFSKVGDCQNIRQYFLGMFDSPGRFYLGDKYAYLQKTIDHFSGSWVRISESVRTGFNVASVLTPLYANPQNCKAGETPLDCEFRIWNPSIVIISMETWTAGRPVAMYDNYLRQIVEYAIAHNVLPILATKADNLEGDNSINLTIARVAHDYDIPLWNFWAASYPLPSHGLSEDGFHLTNGATDLGSSDSMKLGWPVRNATALETIDKVWNAVK